MNQNRLAQIQQALQAADLDGWLFYDFRGSNPIAYRVLDVNPQQTFTRRWYCYVPARGEPVRVVSALEAGNLDAVPGRKIIYRSRQDLAAGLADALGASAHVAMEYSPGGELPVVARVDAGTVEAVRALGKEIVSSADLVQVFEAVLTPEQEASHLEAERRLMMIMQATLDHLRTALARGEPVTEYSVQQAMLGFYREQGLFLDHGPIVGVGPDSGNPHYEPDPARDRPIRPGDFLLIDWWGKLPQPGAVYADYTWVGYLGSEVPTAYQTVFAAVREGRDRAIAFIRERVRAGQPVAGWEVDDVARAAIAARGYGDAFVHRTGHSIGQDLHGNGTNLDNLETRDTRRLLPHTCFSVEPGIYLPDFGIRSEVDVLMGDGDLLVTGRPLQEAVLPILAG